MATEETLVAPLSVLIVNYKTGELTKRCIAKVIQTTSPNILREVIVVDNNSEDDSEQIICGEFPQVRWLANEKNVGFGAAMNRAMAEAVGDYFLLLNSDVEVMEGTIETSLNAIICSQNVAALGCRLVYPNGSDQKSIWRAVGDYRELWNSNFVLTKFGQLEAREIKALMGSFLVIHREVISKVGDFDPDFFMYSEELEWCSRARRWGYDLMFVDYAYAVHDMGYSSDSAWAGRQKYLSNVLLYYKIHGALGCYLFIYLSIINTIINLLVVFKFNALIRRSFWLEQKMFYSNFFRYLSIPILFRVKRGTGMRQLRLQK